MKLSYQTKDNLIVAGIVIAGCVLVPVLFVLLLIFAICWLVLSLGFALVARIMPKHKTSKAQLQIAFEQGRRQGWLEANAQALKQV